MNSVVNETVFLDMDQKQVIHIDRDRCDGCSMCIDTCTTRVLEIVPNRNHPGRYTIFVYPRLCKGYGVCQATCPKGALFCQGSGKSPILYRGGH